MVTVHNSFSHHHPTLATREGVLPNLAAEAILHFCSLCSSNDFDEYWIFHEDKNHERNHRAFYADGIVSPTTASPPFANMLVSKS